MMNHPLSAFEISEDLPQNWQTNISVILDALNAAGWSRSSPPIKKHIN